MTAGYKKHNVLEKIRIEMNREEVVAVVGQNGSGKSTLIKSIIGLITPSKGIIHFKGEDITDHSIKSRVDKGIGYFIQGGRVFPSLSIKENLMLAGHRLSKKTIFKRISSMFSFFFQEKAFASGKIDLEKGFFRQNASELSGGEQHRLALLMVLLNKPELLLLDEPSAGLSPKNAQLLYAAIHDFVLQFKTTILLIEQNVRLAVENSNRILLLKKGRIDRTSISRKLQTKNGSVHPEKIDDFVFGKF
jgi:branched-chain amino acid transport system ATP-binding protein